MHITYSAYLMGRITIENMPMEHVNNMVRLLTLTNNLLDDFGEVRKVNSGYRRLADNVACGGSPRSHHLSAAAIDLEDKDGRFKKWLTEEILDKYDIYMEHGSATPSWVHIQLFPPGSGRRMFYP